VEDKFWCVLVVCVTVIIVSLFWINHLNEKQFIEHGYSRQTLAGSSMAQWVSK
jgi:hypothetical protein